MPPSVILRCHIPEFARWNLSRALASRQVIRPALRRTYSFFESWAWVSNASSRVILSRTVVTERIYLRLKKAATRPAAANFLQQQARFDKFIEVFNERPHEALDMKCPAEAYQPFPASLQRIARY